MPVSSVCPFLLAAGRPAPRGSFLCRLTLALARAGVSLAFVGLVFVPGLELLDVRRRESADDDDRLRFRGPGNVARPRRQLLVVRARAFTRRSARVRVVRRRSPSTVMQRAAMEPVNRTQFGGIPAGTRRRGMKGDLRGSSTADRSHSRELIQKRKNAEESLVSQGFPALFSGEDRKPVELFIAGVRGWDADLRQQVEGGQP